LAFPVLEARLLDLRRQLLGDLDLKMESSLKLALLACSRDQKGLVPRLHELNLQTQRKLEQEIDDFFDQMGQRLLTLQAAVD
jgi:hypothetical protein